jgi:hypothetical protein
MKYEMCITINIGNFQSVKLGVSECESFDEAVAILKKRVLEEKYPIDTQMRKVLKI